MYFCQDAVRVRRRQKSSQYATLAAGIPGGATMPRTCGTTGTSNPASLSVGAFGNPGRRCSLTWASTRMLPARMCSPASSGSITMMSTWPPMSAAMRSPPPGNEMYAQCAPVDFCSSWRTTLSRLVLEPPDCLSFPGFFFAASTNSASVLYGASALTAITAGSSTRRAIGVRSRSVTFASALTSGVCSHTPVNRPIVLGSPLFSARWAAATAELPPGLLTTIMRTGRSFSRSAITASARASTSLPPPGPVCTTSSTVREGLKPWASPGCGRTAIAASSNAPNRISIFLSSYRTALLGLQHPKAPGVELAEQRNHQDHHRQRQHHRRDRPGHQDLEAALRHHQRLAQRPFHARAEREAQDQGRRGVVELAHEVPEQTEHHQQAQIEQAAGGAVYTHQGYAEDQRIEHVDRHPQHQRREQDRGGARARDAEREQRHQRAAGLGIVGALGRGDALDHARAELIAAPGHRFLQPVGQERRDGRAAAGQRSHHKTDDRSVREREAAVLEVLPGRQEIAQALGRLQERGFLARFHVAQHLAQGEHPDRDHDEVDPRQQLHASEGKAGR